MNIQNQELLCCRACLATDCKLLLIHENKLAEVFTRVSGTPAFKDRLPQYVCVYCHTLLLKCASFRSMCLRTQQCLVPQLLKGELTTDYIRGIDRPTYKLITLNSCPVQIIDNVVAKPSRNIKVEPHIEQSIEPEIYTYNIKQEIETDVIEETNTDFDQINELNENEQHIDVAEADQANTHNVDIKRSGLKMEFVNKDYDEDGAKIITKKKRKLKKDVGISDCTDDSVKTSKRRIKNEKVNKEKNKKSGVNKKMVKIEISDGCNKSM